jgi:glycosyltransferase involved in cell wall biosynthesis
MFEYIAKNVGIRRAKGKYVLATNADILFNQELIKFLALEKLSSECFYRIDRYDVGAQVPLDLPVDEQIRFCDKNSIVVRSAVGTIPLKFLSSKNYGIYRNYLRKLFSPREAIRWLMMKFIYKIHTGASGDFTLMAKKSWDKLRGYPELLTQHSMDYYLCAIAKSAGLHQIILRNPLQIYHQPHASSNMGRQSSIDFELYWRDIKRMMQSGSPIILNDETWGLGNEQLQESVVTKFK